MDFEQFMELVKSRRSVRSFTDQKISRVLIQRLIEAASWAPSNHNRQGWKFIVFENHQEIRMLAMQTCEYLRQSLKGTNEFIAGQAEEIIHFAGALELAPVLILAMHKESPAVGKTMLSFATSALVSGEAISTAMACQNLILAAKALGLGSCIMTAPLLAGRVWNSLKNLPAGFEPTCLITIGYPAQIPAVPRRKKLEHIIEYR